MRNTLPAATSAGNAASGVPRCVLERAQELLDFAVLRLLAICLGATSAVQIVALSIAILSAPILHYVPEVVR